MQRRLAAILAADIAEFSRLIEIDEEGTLEAQRKHRRELINPLLDEHGGRIANTAGDSFLIEFPSAVEAVRFAVAVQEGMVSRNSSVPDGNRIAYRVGINVGDVVAQDRDLLGDGVNVAARLEALAPPGGIILSRTARDQVRDRMELNLADLGEVKVKNISRPVRAFQVLRDHETPIRVTNRSKASRSTLFAALALMCALIGGGFYWFGIAPDSRSTDQRKAVATMPSKRSIAILPFTNLGGDPQQEYFADGITEDLITDISKVSGLFVIARNSTFTYKNRSINVRDVASELGVRYVLEGSVRRAGDRVRINSQLTDAETGASVWADRFDRKIGDVFALQDDVTRKIVSALALELTADEVARLQKNAERETTPAVYDLYLRGVEALRQFTPESISRARTHFLRALSIDPNYARAYATMAFSYVSSGTFFRDHGASDAIAQALRYGQRAIALDETLPQAHFALAIAHLRQGRHSEALNAARKAIEFDPNYADGHVALANVLVFSGRGEEAIEFMNRAMQLNPRYSAAYIDILGRAHFLTGQYDEAIDNFNECVSRDPAMVSCHIFLAAAYGLNQQTNDAQWQAEEIRNLEPGFSLQTDRISSHFQKLEDRERYQSGLRAAGVPET